MAIPLVDLKAQYATIKDEVNEAIKDVLESQIFILGPKVKELEDKIAQYSNAKYGIGVSSGSDALLLALMAIDIAQGDEVITTPFTFLSILKHII
jgi:dTDP-4-amino-4,6-dideoxygalactose transaminase